jgi:hypothetical protein
MREQVTCALMSSGIFRFPLTNTRIEPTEASEGGSEY